MRIPILIQPSEQGGFVARSEVFNLSVEGPTRDDVERRLYDAVRDRMQNGAVVTHLDIPDSNPWERFAGSIPDDDLTREWLDAVREHREQCDREPPLPWMQAERPAS